MHLRHKNASKPGRETLTRAALNRALLERQLLVGHRQMSVAAAIEHLAGLQAQNVNSPYVALWSRLEGFSPAQLSRLILGRRAVRASLMRATIHLVTARDFHALRPLIQPVLIRSLRGTFGRRLAGVDTAAVADAGRFELRDGPMTAAGLGRLLQARWPGRDGRVLAYAVQYLAPLVQVPPRGVWGMSGSAMWMSADDWLGRPRRSTMSRETFVTRYLTAFGPASVRDMSTWSGLSGLRETFEGLRRRLRTFRDEHGMELFDLPTAPRPDARLAVPPRFLPDYDNVLLGHADRRRIIADEHRTELGIGTPSVLIDGFVRARWKIECSRHRATLLIQPLGPLRREDRAAVADEGARLLTFAAPDRSERDVRFVRP